MLAKIISNAGAFVLQRRSETLRRTGGSGDSRSRIDDLTMTYRGNQLIGVYDAAGGLSAYDVKEYQDLNNNIRVEDFRYDKNGNMTADLDRDIVTIQYNLLNLPALIQFRDGHQIRNTYAADGRKLRTEYVTAIVSTTVPIGTTITLPVWNSRLSDTVYAGNKEYYFDIYTAYQHRLRRIHNPEGYVNYGFDVVSYNYYRRDHLGNVREVWNAGRCETVEVRPNVFDCAGWLPPSTIQRTMYYPSGLLKDIGFGREQNAYLHNGTEFIEMHGLDVSDHGNRQLYHAIHRYTTIDRFAEKFPWQSPYVHAANNPMLFVDVNGDSVRVYTETNGEGHAWMSVGEGDDMVVYTYGRYNGTYKGPDRRFNRVSNGDGVLLRLTGEEARAYNDDKASKGKSVFVITDVTDEAIANIMDGKFNSSSKIPNNPDSKYYNNPSARVIDEYSLTRNNCTTIVADVLNSSGSSAMQGTRLQQTSSFGTWTTVPVTHRFVIPASMQNHLNRISRPGGTVYRTR